MEPPLRLAGAVGRHLLRQRRPGGGLGPLQGLEVEDHERLRADVARLGLKAQVNGRSVQDVAKDMVAIARQGLKNRNRLSAGMVDESNYLTELEEIADSGVTPAERLLELYNGPWKGDVRRVFEDFAY